MITDVLQIDQGWSAEQRLAAEQVRRFVDQYVLPGIGAHHQNETFPEELVAPLRERHPWSLR